MRWRSRTVDRPSRSARSSSTPSSPPGGRRRWRGGHRRAGSMPSASIRSSMHWSSVPSRIGSRVSAENSGWLLTIGNSRCAWSAATCAGVWFETPTSRILPSERNASSVMATSAGWANMSGRWIWYRSITSICSRVSDASHAERRYLGDESYGVGGAIPPLVASTIRLTQAGRRREDAPEDLLDLAETRSAPVEAVHVGRVDQVHAGVECGLEECLTGRQILVGEPPLPVGDRPDGVERSE